ncbi:23S rRNA (guanosine(2251)-2'-O)-methyltransferase RlmB [candidate division KSB1 bacterium]|nr:23S rRNA (guanosine(2251)-2'-O)-methyltransferase RlmB [candidate division KSB1 bacterium]
MKQIIYGRNAVREWLLSGLPVTQIFMGGDLHGHAVQQILSLARQKNIQIKKIDRLQLSNITGTDNHQGIAAEIKTPDYVELNDILNRAVEKNEDPFIAVLDGVQDPHNFGAIIRSADGAGVHGIIIPKDNSVSLNSTVIKASAGAAAFVPVTMVTNIARTIDELKKKGFWITGVDQDGDIDYTAADYNGAHALVLGSEGSGIRRLVRDKCDFLVSIPMYGHVNSLNVSVAAALLFFQARRQKKIKS